MRGLLRFPGGRGFFPFAFGVAVAVFAFGRGFRRCFLFTVAVAFLGRGRFSALGRAFLGGDGIAELRPAGRRRATGDQQHRANRCTDLQQPPADGDARRGPVERLAEQDREDTEHGDADAAEEQRVGKVREIEDAFPRGEPGIVGVLDCVRDEPGGHGRAAHDDHPDTDLANVHVPPRAGSNLEPAHAVQRPRAMVRQRPRCASSAGAQPAVTQTAARLASAVVRRDWRIWSWSRPFVRYANESPVAGSAQAICPPAPL